MGKYPYFPSVSTEWNKKQKFNSISIKEVTTPTENPDTGYMKIYFKADGKLYKLNSSGVETVSNSTVSAITQALLDAKANINNPSFTGVVSIPNVANLETAVTANTAKVGITGGQASAITANTAKVGITGGQASAITANTAKVGITGGQASAITANTAKVGITGGQASAITANTAKISLDDNSVTLAKLAHGTADKYLGFDSSGVPEEKTVSAGAGNTMIMPEDTTALNHTYSTTTTATAGDTYSETVTDEALAGGTGFSTWTGTGGVEIGDIGGGYNVTSMVYSFTLIPRSSTGGSPLFVDMKTYVKNSAGSIIHTKVWSSVQWKSIGTSYAYSVTVGTLTDAKTIAFFSQENGGQNGTFDITNVLFSGVKAGVTRLPIVMNSTAQDGSSATGYYASIATTNPFVKTDFGSSTRIASVAIMPRTQNTETIFQIQTSDDGSTWVTRRTILASALTSWIYNYVKLTPVSARYVRIYGYSGASKVISFDEIKVKVGISDNTFLLNHYHKDISTTDTSLTLAGD
mgnify:CR=1 FL=1